MKLSYLSVLLGIGLITPGILGFAKPAQLAALARQFPRNFAAGVVLMLLGTAWFVWNVSVEPIADFSVFKPYMMIGFTAVGVLSCIFVRDFLAVRGLAVVMLLLAKLMLDTGRPHLGESAFVPVFQGWAYVFVVLGIWFTITPWRLRDILEWATANEARLRLLSGLRVAFAVFIMILGLTAFHAM